MTYYDFPAENPLPLWRRSAAATVVAGLHVLALLIAFGLAVRPELAQMPQALTVRMFEAVPVPPRTEPIVTPRPQPAPPRKAPAAPPPVLTARAAPTTASSFTVAPQPEPRAVEAQPAPPAPPAPFTAARFDADYLHNPKPVYPPMSRRLGEEGKVVLTVRVSAHGTSLAIEIKQSSGFTRLDEAALTAVERWRFVPARQGSEAIESTVLVPLRFSLDN
ncbi:energy transducer TonB [Propionivibrio sp.]|uniref:energy transducer TonB n=1 Tax=Propionivibrio sp. TaxID=2212460 RepID=UPI003BF0062B